MLMFPIKPRRTLPDHIDLPLGKGGEVRIAVQCHPRAKYLRIRFLGHDHSFRMSAPAHTSLSALKAFIRKNKDWIENHYHTAQKPLLVKPGMEIILHGQPLVLKYDNKLRGQTSLHKIGENKSELRIPGDMSGFKRRLVVYLKQQARLSMQAYCDEYTKKLGVSYQQLRLSDPKKRWGSCSSSGTLSFSWRIIMAPPYVQRYLAAHEVAHIKEMHHQRSFWALVEQLEPEWKKGHGWLKDHGTQLMLYDFS